MAEFKKFTILAVKSSKNPVFSVSLACSHPRVCKLCPAWVNSWAGNSRGAAPAAPSSLPSGCRRPRKQQAANTSLISASHPRSFHPGDSAVPRGTNLGYKFMIHGAFGMQVMKHNEGMESTHCGRTIPAFHPGNIPVFCGTSLDCCPGRKNIHPLIS